MSNIYYTPITPGAQANAGTMNAPLSELDAVLNVSHDADGTLKAGAVDTTAVLADHIVTADKLAAAVAGNGLSGGAGSALAVNVDDSTIEISSDSLRAKDGGITNAKMATDVKVGSLALLLTTVKTSLQAAVNEVYTRLAGISNADGTLKDGAVSASAKMGTGVVAETNIAANAVTTAKILDANVTGAKLADTAVTADKLATAVAGDGLSGGAGAALSVNVDGSSIETSGDTLRVKAAGISASHLATAVAGDGLTGGAGTALAVVVDANTIEISADALRVKAAGIGASQLAAAVAGNGLSGGAGAALAVNVDDSTLEVATDTVRAKDGGITNAKLASDAKAGSLASLTTTNKTSLQAAINEVDAQTDALGGGATVDTRVLKAWTQGEDYEPTSVTRNASGIVTSATVVWPDGSAGTFTTDTINTTWEAIDAYHITHTASGKTITQAAVSRNSAGAVITKPALTIV